MSPHPFRLRLRRRRATLIAAALLAGATAAPLAVSPASATATPPSPDGRFQRDADAVRDTGAVGVQARVTGPFSRSTAVTSGTADLRTGAPVPANGYFRTASNTKTYVATVVLQLAAEHRLTLDDSVERWLPGVVRGHGNDGRKITLRQLLQHTSGIHDDYPGFDDAEEYEERRFRPYSPEQLVARAMRHRPDFAPGKGWAYSNVGYMLLGMVVEKATGKPWHDEVRTRLIEPLKLRHTYYPGSSPTLRSPHARGYQHFATAPKLVDVTLLRDANASGALIATTADLNRFYRALLGGKVLPAAQLKEMKRTVPLSEEFQEPYPGGAYGLGLMRTKLPCGGYAWGHGGDEAGYMSRNAVTGDGRHAATVSVSTEWSYSKKDMLRQHRAATKVVNRAVCASRAQDGSDGPDGPGGAARGR
ncbi:serine hydrolase domain-containing protein [Streptomyces sp. NPDC048172]|uniref:serine hydrolase domain-containing protein n=1 Tax=Streptomyces sp. NPDC048172 TaxID=3365505 RepID=UPI0037184B4D